MVREFYLPAADILLVNETGGRPVADSDARVLLGSARFPLPGGRFVDLRAGSNRGESVLINSTSLDLCLRELPLYGSEGKSYVLEKDLHSPCAASLAPGRFVMLDAPPDIIGAVPPSMIRTEHPGGPAKERALRKISEDLLGKRLRVLMHVPRKGE